MSLNSKKVTKQDLLNKYFGQAPKIKLETEEDKPISSDSQSNDEDRPARIHSDDDSQQEVQQYHRKQQSNSNQIGKMNKRQRKIKKKIAKALGLQQNNNDGDDRMDDFYREMKVQGLSLEELTKMHKKANVSLQEDHGKKKKKSQIIKFQGMLNGDQDSDVQIPQSARVVHRNKDGSIRPISIQQEKKQLQETVYKRLAEWETGMLQKSSSEDQAQIDYLLKRQVFDDPMRQFDESPLQKLFTCKHPAPANRFDIKPGFRWDGVVRGNGFQNKYLQHKNMQKAQKAQEDADYIRNL